MTRKDVYEKGLWSYGYVALLAILEFRKQSEEYEDCALILSVLKEHYKEFNLNLPTEFSIEAIEEWGEAFWKFGKSGQNAVLNLPAYVQDIEMWLEATEA